MKKSHKRAGVLPNQPIDWGEVPPEVQREYLRRQRWLEQHRDLTPEAQRVLWGKIRERIRRKEEHLGVDRSREVPVLVSKGLDIEIKWMSPDKAIEHHNNEAIHLYREYLGQNPVLREITDPASGRKMDPTKLRIELAGDIDDAGRHEERDEHRFNPMSSVGQDVVAKQSVEKQRQKLLVRARREWIAEQQETVRGFWRLHKSVKKKLAKRAIPTAESAAEYLDVVLPGGQRPKLGKREKRRRKAISALWTGPGLLWIDDRFIDEQRRFSTKQHPYPRITKIVVKEWQGCVVWDTGGWSDVQILRMNSCRLSPIFRISPNVIVAAARSLARKLIRGRSDRPTFDDIAVEFIDWIEPGHRYPTPPW